MYYNKTKNPSAYVTVGKQRIKQHNLTTSGSLIGTNEGTVYLSDNTEFEIELFNSLQTKVVAEISLNGTKLTGGIVLRPGDRIYLDRYINENRKFLFSTYSVENSNEVLNAIANNGLIEVNFYREKIEEPITWTNYVWPEERFYYYDNNTNQIFPNIININNEKFVSPNSLNSVNTFTSSVSNDNIFNTSSVLISGLKTKKTLETGRIEKGNTSNQRFNKVGIELESLPINIFKWKILPKSTELIYKEDIVSYCGECGSKKRKESHKFCPHCGNKF